MPDTNMPRSGSMQFWPRVRSKRETARVRRQNTSSEAKPAIFAGYKVGMTHISVVDNRKTSQTKGTEITVPVTVIECPPLKVAAIRFYKNSISGAKCISQIITKNLDKELSKKISVPKKEEKKIETKKVKNLIDGLSRKAIGSSITHLNIQDTSGIAVSTKDFLGKYLLIDFWSSRCGPCRKENPNIEKAYQKYKDKGFEIYGVSFDSNREEWIDAINKDGISCSKNMCMPVVELRTWNILGNSV